MDQTRKLEVYQEVVRLLDEAGYESNVREDYSGRGMYGNTCLAIVTDAPGTLIGYFIGLTVSEEDDHWHPDDVIPTRSDAMGLQTVYY